MTPPKWGVSPLRLWGSMGSHQTLRMGAGPSSDPRAGRIPPQTPRMGCIPLKIPRAGLSTPSDCQGLAASFSHLTSWELAHWIIQDTHRHPAQEP